MSHFTVFQCLAFLIAFVLSESAPAAEQSHPSVIIIFTDDQGSLDLGCYGAADLQTPNLDRLASRGVRFTQFYSSAPVCSPSRAGLMTGLSPQAAGVPGNVGLTAEGMPSDRITIAEVMKDAGYATAHIGKWHLGHHDDTVPNAQGFDHSFGHYVGCIDNYSHFFYWSGPNKHDLWRNNKHVHHPGEFFPDLMLKEAKQFISSQRDQPFFMYFAMNIPHYPYQGSEQWLNRYADLPYPRNLYAAFVSTMDQKIGELLSFLDDQGRADNTIIVFQSDHGHSTEERAHFGGGFCGPYRGAKFSLYEGGIRVPAIISWPGHLPQNEVRDQMAVSCDWYPTILDLCAVPPVRHELAGKSLVPILNDADADSQHRMFHWQQSGQWVVREGNWKLCHDIVDTSGRERVTVKGDFLYDIAADPSESKDLSQDHPDVVKRLRAGHDTWAESWK